MRALKIHSSDSVVGPELETLLRELTDSEPCEYDHNGLCQAHALDERPCPHERAKVVLAIAKTEVAKPHGLVEPGDAGYWE